MTHTTGSTHRSARRHTSVLARMLLLAVAAVMLLAGCVMPDGTVYTLPVEASVAQTEQPAEPAADAVADDEPSPAQPYIDEGDTALDARDYEAALEAYDRAIKADPTAPYGHYGRGLTYFILRDYETALADLDQALVLAPTDPEIALFRADTLMNMGEWKAIAVALDNLFAATNEGEDLDVETRWQAYRFRGEAREAIGDVAGAANDYARAVQTIPWYTGYFHEYRRLLGGEDLVRESDVELDRFAVKSTSSGRGDYVEGMKLLLLARLTGNPEAYASALGSFDAAIDADPDFMEGYHARGVALTEAATLVELTGLVELSDRAVFVDPFTGNTTTIDREAYESGRQRRIAFAEVARERSIDDLRRATKLEPLNAEAVHDLGVMLFAEHDIGFDAVFVIPAEASRDEVLALFDQAVELDPEWDRARLSRALANFHWGSADYDTIVSSGDGGATLRERASDLLSEALDDANHLIDSNAGDGWPYLVRAFAKFKLANLSGDEIDDAFQDELEADATTFMQLSPNANFDDLWSELPAYVQFSTTLPTPDPMMSGHLENRYPEMVYVNEALGLEIVMPDCDSNSSVHDIYLPDGPALVSIDDDYHTFEILALAGDLGQQEAQEWLTAQMQEVIESPFELAKTIEAEYGTVSIGELPGPAYVAVIPVEDKIIVVVYRPTALTLSSTIGFDMDDGVEILMEFLSVLSFTEG